MSNKVYIERKSPLDISRQCLGRPLKTDNKEMILDWRVHTSGKEVAVFFSLFCLCDAHAGNADVAIRRMSSGVSASQKGSRTLVVPVGIR